MGDDMVGARRLFHAAVDAQRDDLEGGRRRRGRREQEKRRKKRSRKTSTLHDAQSRKDLNHVAPGAGWPGVWGLAASPPASGLLALP